MRHPSLCVWHCSATKLSMDYPMASIRRDHIKRGFRKEGYHIYYRKDGSREFGRSFNEVGAHARGYNTRSIGLCYEGGLGEDGSPADTRTPEQKEAMRRDKKILNYIFPEIKHVGHRDLSVDLNGDGIVSKGEWMKVCPSFDVKTEF